MSSGVLFAVFAYCTWGLFPAFWKTLHEVPWQDITAHRMVWAAPCFAIILWLRFGKNAAALLSHTLKKHIALLILSALLIGSNWLLYIYMVNRGRVVEASLGYFVNPLINVCLGMLFLRERLRPAQWLAVAIASAGVGYMTWQAGHLPVEGLVLASTFGFYGLIRKKVPIEPLAASTVEGLFLCLPAVVFLLAPAALGSPQTHLIHDGRFSLIALLLLGGAVTAVPLWFFVEAARRIPLSTLGILQYLSPSLQFSLAVFVYGEAFTVNQAVCFGFIWVALAIYSIDLVRSQRLKGACNENVK